jgi:hypothetical protein
MSVRQIAFFLVVVVTAAGVVAHTAAASGPDDGQAAPIFGINLPLAPRRNGRPA